ncbi:MAG: hypothetical protein U0O44_00520 [Eggerthellaceae bacterium]|nr:hypothetical protein [Eggerthellaceae bacterium]
MAVAVHPGASDINVVKRAIAIQDGTAIEGQLMKLALVALDCDALSVNAKAA